jgi:uncharacterized protein YbjT (DUF2867 family)
MTDTIILAGATGDLGGRIAAALVRRGALVRALVRPGLAADKLARLEATGATAVPVDFADAAALADSCRGGACVVSALSGLDDVILGVQGRLLGAAVAAGVPRFIPSDFALDYRAIPPGLNRNFDLRRRFKQRVDAAPIRATSIWNGAFMDMLAGQMPLIQRPIRRVLYWQDPYVRFPLTTKDDTAAFTAAAALDPEAPRDLHIAGSSVSARDLVRIMTDNTGEPYKLLRAGSLGRLKRLIAVTRTLFPQREALFPAWQGMQYLHNMFAGLAPAEGTDNDRYPGLSWTRAEDMLKG